MRSKDKMPETNTPQTTVNKQRLDQCICPITKKIMRDPIAIRQIVPEHGENVTKTYIFEREAIVDFVKQAEQNSQDPKQVKIGTQLVTINIYQVIETNYEIIEIDSHTSLPPLLEEKKVYTTNDGNYYLRDPAGACKHGIFACNASSSERNKNVKAAMTANGHNMFLIADLSKRREISQFLTEYPKFWDCGAVYFPKAWQEELYSLICQKKPDDAATHLNKIKICLAKDHRLLTAKLGEEQITACSLACSYATSEIIFSLIANLKTPKDIRQIIDEGMLEQVNNIGNTPLHKAAASGHCELATTLLKHGAQVNTKNIEGNTPIHLAVQKKHLELLKILLKYKADVTIKNAVRQTAIAMELLVILTNPDHAWKATEILQALLKQLSQQEAFKNSDLNKLAENAGYAFPLHLAIIIKDYDLLNALLMQTPVVHLTPALEETPYLCIAALQNDLEAMKILLKAGAKPTLTNKEKNTILHIAVEHGYTNVLQWLLNDDNCIRASIINMQNIDGNTALHIAATKKDTTIAQQLINCGAMIKLLNKHGKAAKDLAEDTTFGSMIENTAENYQYQEIARLTAEACTRSRQLADLQAKTTQRTALSFSGISDTSSNSKKKVAFNWEHPLATGHYVSYTDNTITIINNLQTNTVLYASCDNNVSPNCLLVLSNRKLVTVCSNQTISIRKINNTLYEEPHLRLVGHQSAIQCVQELTPKFLASSSDDGTIKIWNLTTGHCHHTIRQQNLTVQCFCANQDMTMLACGAANGEVRIFNLFNSPQGSLTGKYKLPVTSLQMVTTDLLAIGLQDGTIKIVNLNTSSLSRVKKIAGPFTWGNKCRNTTEAPGHTSAVQCITIFNNEMISCSANEIKIWDLSTFECNGTIHSKEGETLRMHHYANSIKIIGQIDQTITSSNLQDLLQTFKLEQQAAKYEQALANQGWIPYLLGYKP